MLMKWKMRRRIKAAYYALIAKNDINHLYGIHWGDPEQDSSLMYVRDHFVLPYISPDSIIVEIGPGGGRWTRYLLGAKQVYGVDYYQELLDELRSNFDDRNIICIKNNGDDFPGIPDKSIDFIFSFGTFVHLDIDIIDRYLHNMKRILMADSTVVIQYSDKTKPLGASTKCFSENDPKIMRKAVLDHGYSISEEDLNLLSHSSIIRFGLSNTDLTEIVRSEGQNTSDE